MGEQLRTTRGYDFGEVASAMQKAIRRGDARSGGYWVIELFESGYFNYVWKRLLTISAEDCWGILTQEVAALHAAFQTVNTTKTKDGNARGRIFIAKAVILLASAKKSRDADHLTNLIYDAQAMDGETLAAELRKVRCELEDSRLCH